MAACSFQYRNKWENQKIQKFYVKKHKGVASRQHKFPKLSSNSARPFVRNWAQISKLKCRVKYKNECHDLCQEIQKYKQSLHRELELTSSHAYAHSYTMAPTHTLSTSTLHNLTLADYIDANHPLSSRYNERENINDELLQIAIEQSLQTYVSEPSYTSAKKEVSTTDAYEQDTCAINIYTKPTETLQLDASIPTTTPYTQMDLKVTIQLHNVLGIDPATLSPKQYTTILHRCHRHYPDICTCAYKALSYTLKECNMEIRIHNKMHSFCFIPTTNAQYSVMIDEKKYSFAVTEHEQTLMDQSDKSIPVVFERHDVFCCPYSSERDNRRLLQIAQKCFEKVLHKRKSIEMNYLPVWKYSKQHYTNDTFAPSVCVLKDLLLDAAVPLHVDIIHVLLSYVSCTQFECVVIESTLHLPSQYACCEDILRESVSQRSVELKCGTENGVKYVSPFETGKDDFITFISPNTVYSYDGMEYNCKGKEIAVFGYSKQRTKQCVPFKQSINKPVSKPIHKPDSRWIRRLNDGVYNEAQRRKDIKRKKTKGKKRKRRNRKYLLKPIMKHRRRKQKKKYKKHVHHPRSIKKKRFRSKVNKALQRWNGHWDKVPYYERIKKNGTDTWLCKWDYEPSYCYHFNYSGSSAQYASGSDYIQRARSNKRCAPKTGRKNTRVF